MTEVQTPAAPETAGTCPRCGTPLHEGQDWCLGCGAAVTTHVAGAPGWRTPVAIVGAVLLLAALGLGIAFLELSDDADRVARAPGVTPTPVPTATPAATPTPTPTPTPEASPTPAPAGEIGSWPEGEEAWTVVLESSSSRDDAQRRAEELRDAGKSVGILNSDEFESLRAGYWVVFSGQYDDQEAAQAAAGQFADVAPDAYARLVTPRP